MKSIRQTKEISNVVNLKRIVCTGLQETFLLKDNTKPRKTTITHYSSDKGFKGTVVNQADPSVNGESEI